MRANPADWVAQDLVMLSSQPTFADGKLEPRAVDLRAFVLQSRRGDRTHVEVVPAALSRVAPAGEPDRTRNRAERGLGARIVDHDRAAAAA